jgi:hypothetical protein
MAHTHIVNTTPLLESIYMKPRQTTVMNREETVNTLKCLPLGEIPHVFHDLRHLSNSQT